MALETRRLQAQGKAQAVPALQDAAGGKRAGRIDRAAGTGSEPGQERSRLSQRRLPGAPQASASSPAAHKAPELRMPLSFPLRKTSILSLKTSPPCSLPTSLIYLMNTKHPLGAVLESQPRLQTWSSLRNCILTVVQDGAPQCFSFLIPTSLCSLRSG